MAQAICLQPREDRYEGNNAIFVARVQFIGTDLPNGPDATTITFTVVPGDSPQTIGGKIVAAIDAEAARLGYTLPNNSRLIPSYVKA